MDTTDGGESWADWIRWAMGRHGLTAPQLARRVGVERSTMHRWLNGKRTVTASSARGVAEALGEDPERALRAAGVLPEAAESITDPDLLQLTRMLADPDVPEAEKNSIRAALRYLAELAEQQQADRPGRVIRRRAG